MKHIFCPKETTLIFIIIEKISSRTMDVCMKFYRDVRSTLSPECRLVFYARPPLASSTFSTRARFLSLLFLCAESALVYSAEEPLRKRENLFTNQPVYA